MNRSKAIALSAVSAALATIFLVIGDYFPTLSLGSAFLAGIVMMVPLSKKLYLGAALAYLASAALAFLISSFIFEAILPFLMFFGLQPIVNRLQLDRNWNKYLMLVIKDLWFVGAAVGYYFIFSVVLFENNEALNAYALPIIIAISAAAYILYDYLSFYFQKYIDLLITRLKL